MMIYIPIPCLVAMLILLLIWLLKVAWRIHVNRVRAREAEDAWLAKMATAPRSQVNYIDLRGREKEDYE